MTDHVRTTMNAARAGGRPLARVAALLGLLVGLGSAVSAQTPTWEMLPLFPQRNNHLFVSLGWLRGEGAQANDPEADTLVAFAGGYGAMLHNPSGAAGAAGDNGEWGAWHRLCAQSICSSPQDGIVTSAGTLLIGSSAGATQLGRGTNRGRTWAFDFGNIGAFPLFDASRAGADARPVVIAGVSNDGRTRRSFADGAPGTWELAGTTFSYSLVFAEVPVSGALPTGRILAGTWSGIATSSDGGVTYAVPPGYGGGRYIGYSFAFVAQAGHPYGGVAYAGLQRAANEFGGAEVHRSDDGGATWTLAHAFTAAEMELPVPGSTDVSEVILLATPDGALWAGVSQGGGAGNPRRGGVMRSADGGATWSRADVGFRDTTERGYAVTDLSLSRTGVLYAATTRGVWRTTGPAVAGEAGPVPSGEVGVSVRPNPAGRRVEVVVRGAERATVEVYDGLGRRVWQGEAVSGTVALDTSAWPSGVYVVRALVAGRVTSARLVVAR